MTTYGWDASHYDGPLDKTILARAKAEGVEFFSHKLGEGVSNVDPTAATALAAARDVGISLLGGYWFNHGNDAPADEVAALLKQANTYEPWWKTFAGWFWQADLETSPTGLPSPAWAVEFCDRLEQATGRKVLAYASHGMYGDRLAGLKHPLWNANYGPELVGSFKSIYPGDSSPGWAPYSGQTPTLLQYSSKATIAGLTTCDANAYRGTLAQLTALITGGVPVTAPISQLDDATLTAISAKVWGQWLGKSGPSAMTAVQTGIAHDAAHQVLAGLSLPADTPTMSLGTAVLAIKAEVEVLAAAVAKLPVTAVPAAPLSDADKDDIAARVVAQLRAHPLAPTA